jgi:hypothetical protein
MTMNRLPTVVAALYQKLGDGEATQIYRRIINDLADQKEASAIGETALVTEI